MTRQQDKADWSRTGVFPDPTSVPGLIENASDIAIALDSGLAIQGIAVSPNAPELGCLDHWAGRTFDNFLTEESRAKFTRRIDQLRKNPSMFPGLVELNHVDNATWEFPVKYSVHQAVDGGLLLLGRDMQPIADLQRSLVNEQLAREQDYRKLRAEEAFFRVVLDASETPLVLVEPKQGRIRDLNGAAAGLLGSVAASLTGSMFSQAFEGRRRDELSDALQSAASSEDGRAVEVTCRSNGRVLHLMPRYFRASDDLFLLCRIFAVEAEAVAVGTAGFMDELFAQSTDAVVVTDTKGMIRDANEAFLMMADALQLRNLKEMSLSDLLARGTVDTKMILEAADKATRLRSYNTQVISPIGTRTSVDISATRLRQRGGVVGYGLIMRDVTRSEPVEADAGAIVLSDDAMKHMMDLVGTASLKELVSATSDVVEKMCIETALQLTSNNRAATAEMLGLSRQSLYVKLRKHGFIDDSDDS